MAGGVCMRVEGGEGWRGGQRAASMQVALAGGNLQKQLVPCPGMSLERCYWAAKGARAAKGNAPNSCKRR